MQGLLEWLLGLERIRLSDGPLSFELAQPPAAWVMLAGAILVFLLVGFVYRYEHGHRRLRVFLAVVRACVLLLVLGMLSRPHLVLRRERVDPSVVAVLVDASSSMNVADGLAPGEATSSGAASGPADGRITRHAQVMKWLSSGVLESLRRRHRVEVWTFSDAAQRADRAADKGTIQRMAATQPSGRQSDAGEGLAEVLEQTQGSRLAAVILLGDGRQTLVSGVDRAVELARQRMVPVYATMAGSERGVLDVCVESVAADSRVFLRDIASVRARVGIGGAAEPAEQMVQLVDSESGEVLDRRALRLGASSQASEGGAASAFSGEVEMRFRPRKAGPLALRVEAMPAEDEVEKGNNSAEVVMQVLDQKLRVLYVEGPPRFEYRFLKNTLLRETTVTSSCLLLDATASFVQEGSEPIRRFPISPGELGAYDLVLLGDVDPRDDWISPSQMAMLVDFVAVRGGGLGFIAGQRAMPQRLRGTPLEKLLPVRIDPDAGRGVLASNSPFAMAPTADGRRGGLLRFEVDPDQNDATIAALGDWYWFARVLGRKPGAEVLAVHPTETCADGPMPLLVSGRYGAGRTLFVGSDDVWRWRRYEGEAFYDTFWMNSLRWLSGERRAGAAQPWRLESDRRQYELGTPAAFRLSARDREMAAGVPWVELRIQRADGEAAANIRLERVSGDLAEFEGSYWPDREGVLTAVAAVPGAASEALPSANVSVHASDAEGRDTRADPAFLASLASRTGGRRVLPEELSKLARTIPDRSMRIADDVVEPLWDTKLVLLAFVLLLSTEWTARKLKGLA